MNDTLYKYLYRNGTYDMLFKFLYRNGIYDMNDFIKKSDFKLDGLQTSISNSEISYSEFTNSEVSIITLSQISGFCESDIQINKSFFAVFSNLYSKDKGNQYSSERMNMLDYSPDDIMKNLSTSFDEEPINTISIDGKYYISSNDLHRFMALKLYYLLELYQGKSEIELDKKYVIKINNKKINIFKTFTQYFGNFFNPPIKLDEDLTKQEWLELVKEKLSEINIEEYQSLISDFSLSHFINDISGELMIKNFFEYFPNIAVDIFKNLIISDNYEYSVNIINCAKKYYPSIESELIKIIDNKFNETLQSNELVINTRDNWEYFDLEKKWNEYGEVKDIFSIEKDLEQFSEGSEALRKCLRIIWSRGIETTASCKGNHLSIDVYNNPNINCEAYIAFQQYQDWQKFLSSEIINNDDVIICSDAIYYYGSNNDLFFKTLSKDFLTGVKNNCSLISAKDKSFSDELDYKSFIIALHKIGFDEGQIEQLAYDYMEIEKCRKQSSQIKSDEERKRLNKTWDRAWENYNCDLSFYVNRNNHRINNQKNENKSTK